MNKFLNILVTIASLTILLFFGFYIFAHDRITGDTASHILLSVSPLMNIGGPYVDYWEIKPPVWPLTVYLWSRVFGFGIMSIKILNMSLVTAVMLLTFLVYRKIFKSPILELLFLFTIVINFSPLLQTLILPTELLGLMFSLLALFILLSARRDFWNFGFSGLLFFLASQTKEPYTFTILSVFPIFVLLLLKKGYSDFFKKLTVFLGGITVGILILFIFLESSGASQSYFQVFKYKEVFYPFSVDRMFRNFGPAITATNNTFIQFSGGLLLLSTLALFIFLLTNKSKKFVNFNPKLSELTAKQWVIVNPGTLPKYVAAFYAIGSFLGFGLGGVFGSHYLIQAVIPFYLLTGLVFSYISEEFIYITNKNKNYFIFGLVTLLLSIIIILPKRQYLKSYLTNNIEFAVADRVYSYEERIMELSTSDQCVLSVYGWGVGENYLYSKRRPCTRFFLPNIVKEDWQKKEYVQSLLKDPPAVIRYVKAGADMDIDGFESGVINLEKVVKNCYVNDKIETTLFIPKTKDRFDLATCIEENSK